VELIWPIDGNLADVLASENNKSLATIATGKKKEGRTNQTKPSSLPPLHLVTIPTSFCPVSVSEAYFIFIYFGSDPIWLGAYANTPSTWKWRELDGAGGEVPFISCGNIGYCMPSTFNFTQVGCLFLDQTGRYGVKSCVNQLYESRWNHIFTRTYPTPFFLLYFFTNQFDFIFFFHFNKPFQQPITCILFDSHLSKTSTLILLVTRTLFVMSTFTKVETSLIVTHLPPLVVMENVTALSSLLVI
jgi:hypothetical protein